MKDFKNDSTSTLSRFGRDKRERTSASERVERRPRLQRDADGAEPSRGRASFNPNFTPDNRPVGEHTDRDGRYADKKPYGAKRTYDKPYGERRSFDKPQGDRPYGERRSFDKPQGDKPYGERRSYDKQQGDKPYGERRSYDKPQGDRPYGERRSFDKPRGDKPYGERRSYDKQQGDKPYGERRSYDKPQGDKPYGERRSFDKPRGDKPYGERRSFDKPYGDKPYGERRSFDKPQGDKPYGERRSFDKPYGGKPRGQKPAYGSYRDDDRNGGKRTYRRDDRPKEYPKFDPNKITGEIRLNRFIAQSGICSRREADDFISAGLVTVNGTVVTELGTKVRPEDEVRFNDSRVEGEKKVYLVLNKPKGFVTSLEDPHADKTVMDLVKGACTERIYPVGRLDKNSVGLLLFTNDGDLTRQLTHPSYHKKKVYQVSLDNPLTRADMDSIAEGITLEDGEIHADAISYVKEDKKEVGVEIHSGRNRIVRRIFEHLGYSVRKLDRVYYAGLTKKNLKRGAWRFLTTDEVNRLKSGQYE